MRSQKCQKIRKRIILEASTTLYCCRSFGRFAKRRGKVDVDSKPNHSYFPLFYQYFLIFPFVLFFLICIVWPQFTFLYKWHIITFNKYNAIYFNTIMLTILFLFSIQSCYTRLFTATRPYRPRPFFCAHYPNFGTNRNSTPLSIFRFGRAWISTF